MKNEDPLCVERIRLTKNSDFIGELIDDENQLEMNDFEPETVALFLTFLEDGQLTELQSSQFRELHKMATVFKVIWLKKDCRKWLFSKLEREYGIDEHDENGRKGKEKENTDNTDGEENSGDTERKYLDLLFVFEECLFVLRKWEGVEMDMMEEFIAKRAGEDNSSFVAKYLENLAKLDTIQLGWMLKLEVSDLTVFLEPLLFYIADKVSLDHRIRFLLKNIDLVRCCSENQEMYDQLFHCLREMKELTREDTSFIFKLYMETIQNVLSKTSHTMKSIALTTTSLNEVVVTAAASSSKDVKDFSRTTEHSSETKDVSSRDAEPSSLQEIESDSSGIRPFVALSGSRDNVTSKERPKEVEQERVLFDGWAFSQLAVNCARVWDISELIHNGTLTSMFEVIELLLQVYYKITNFPGAKELTMFKRGLRTACVDKKMQKASPKYINMITSALIHSPFQQKTTLTRLLNSFIKDDTLCSQTDNLDLQEDMCIEDPLSGGYKHVFILSRDQTLSRDCDFPGMCGFVVKGGPNGTDQFWLDELCTNEEDYKGTKVHYHGDVLPRDMFYYSIWSGARAMTRVRVPDRVLASCKQWLPDVSNWVTECVCVQYRVTR